MTDITGMTKKELLEAAAELGIEVDPKGTKAQILAAIEAPTPEEVEVPASPHAEEIATLRSRLRGIHNWGRQREQVLLIEARLRELEG